MQPAVHFHDAAWVCVRLQRTGLVDRRHLNSTGGQRGLGFKALPFKRRHWGEEVVLVPAVLLGRRKGELVENDWNSCYASDRFS